MTRAAEAPDVAQAGDVLLNLPPQRAFHQIVAVEDADDLGQFLFGQVLGPPLRVSA